MEIDIRPKDFLSETPPHRVMGTEIEQDSTLEPGQSAVYLLTDAGIVHEAGHLQCASPDGFLHLRNGAVLYEELAHPDNEQEGLVEYASQECLGPRQLEAATKAGEIIMEDIAAVAKRVTQDQRKFRGKPPLPPGYPAIYRHTGTLDMHGAILTKAHHISLLMPTEVLDQHPELFEALLGSHGATQAWSWEGRVGHDGFVWFQKHPHVNYLYTAGRYVPEGFTKQMIAIRREGADAELGWTRIEVRGADYSSSPEANFLSYASYSLVLRMLEHWKKLNTRGFLDCLPRSPVNALRQINESGLSTALETSGCHSTTANDVQEHLADLALELSGKIQLPEDELLAAYQWRSMCDDMRRYEKSGDLSHISHRVGAAAKLQVLQEKYGDALTYRNVAALRDCLLWNRITPQGEGQKHFAKYGQRPVTRAEIDAQVKRPPATRAAARAAFLATHADSVVYIHWGFGGSYDYEDNNIVTEAWSPYGEAVSSHLAREVVSNTVRRLPPL